MKAFEVQFYPYKEHPEIIEEFFGYRFKKSVDSLFSLFDYISEPILEVGFFKEKYFLIQKGNLFGVIRQNGSILIPPKYVQVIPTEGERFFLMDTNFKWGFKGIIPESHEHIYDYIIESPCIYDEIGEYSEGFYVVKLKEKYGYAPLIKDNICITPQYDDARPFHEGIAAVEKNGKWGFIDKTRSHITQFEFDEVDDFNNGRAYVWKNGKQFQIDFNGRDTKEQELHFGQEYEKIDKWHEGLFAVQNEGKLGFVDTLGNIHVPLEYHYRPYSWGEKIPCFSEGFACVCKSGYWGFIDKRNRVVFPFILDNYSPLHSGVAIATDGMPTSRVITIQHFFKYIHGQRIPFHVNRQPRKPKYDYHDTGWTRRELEDAYMAAMEDDIRNEWNID